MNSRLLLMLFYLLVVAGGWAALTLFFGAVAHHMLLETGGSYSPFDYPWIAAFFGAIAVMVLSVVFLEEISLEEKIQGIPKARAKENNRE